MLKEIFLFFLLAFVVACSGTSNMSGNQYGDLKGTNYVQLVKSIEFEDIGSGKYYYIDGDINGAVDINSVKLFCKEKNGNLVSELNGTYNSGRFSFTLPITQGEYILTVELTDLEGRKYIQKNISLLVR
ncbi:MAG: hypothetical protein ACP5QT_06260 [Brevinematia bacterium]